MNRSRSKFAACRRTAITNCLMALGLVMAPALVHAQTATISGSVGNFDVVNNTGENACGFEMDFEGVTVPGFYTFSYQRYGTPTFAPYTTGAVSGMRVSWKSPDCSTVRTVPHALGASFAGTCYMGGLSYDTAGCEHFGASVNSGIVTSRWLINDPANPGAYIPRDPPMAVPVPYYYIQPAAVAGAAPVVVAVVEAPEPPEAPELYGNPTWMKTFVRQMPREVTLDELLTTNSVVVPMDVAQLEFDWQLVQADPTAGTNARRNRGRHQGGSTLDPTTRAVVRRYETYAYTGATDPLTNEALCADLLCKVPGATEIGDFISAQMAAVNVQGDFITVAKSGTGGGNVDSADKRIACGSKCVSPYSAGTGVSLTAKANSGSTFAGWTGACAGTQTCTVTVNGAQTVGATFNTQAPAPAPAPGGGGGGGSTPSSFTLKVSASNSGTISSDVGGINCGLACSATVVPGSVVTLTATPPAGKTFAGWSGACIGTVATCTLTVNANLSAKANFNK